MAIDLALAMLSVVVLNVPSVLVLFRMIDHLDQVTATTRRITVTVGNLALIFLIAGGATTGYFLVHEVTGNALLSATIAFTVLGVCPFLFVEELLYHSYVEDLDT